MRRATGVPGALALPRLEDSGSPVKRRASSIRERGNEHAEGLSACRERCQEGQRGAAAGQEVQNKPQSIHDCSTPFSNT